MPSSATHKFDHQWPRLVQPFAAFSRSIEVWDNKNFNTTDALLIKMDQILQFSNFLDSVFFWKSAKHHKHSFRVIFSIGSFSQTSVYRQEWSFWVWLKIKAFTCPKNKHCFAEMPFYQSIDLSRMTTGSALEQPRPSLKIDKTTGILMSLSIKSKWPSKLKCIALSSMENHLFAPINNLSSVFSNMSVLAWERQKNRHDCHWLRCLKHTAF